MTKKIDSSIQIANSGIGLGLLSTLGKRITKDGWDLVKIGMYDSTRPIYLATKTLGTLPNASTKTFTYALPSFYGMLEANLMAYDSGGVRIPLPYINLYPNQYAAYWIGIESITNTAIQINAGTDRSSYNLWATFIYVATGEVT